MAQHIFRLQKSIPNVLNGKNVCNPNMLGLTKYCKCFTPAVLSPGLYLFALVDCVSVPLRGDAR